MRDLTGWQTTQKRLKTTETQDECILGYSQFVVRSQVQPLHQRTFAFVVFDSTNPKWDIDWCNTPQHGRNFCYDNFNETSRREQAMIAEFPLASEESA
jgi:hypothetical protein